MIFYLSFHKLDPKAKTFVEKKGSMIKSSDTECFELRWAFEKKMQKMSKTSFYQKSH